MTEAHALSLGYSSLVELMSRDIYIFTLFFVLHMTYIHNWNAPVKTEKNAFTRELDEAGESDSDTDNDHFQPRPTRASRPFRSRIIDSIQEKPWITNRPISRADKIATWIPRCGLILGSGIIIAFIYGGWTSWETNKFCLIMEDNFDHFDTDIWSQEVELGGFGTGEFEWTTTSEENTYVKDGKLYLVPTVDTWPQVDGTVLNLSATGECTSDPDYSGMSRVSACEAMRNVSADTYIPPIRSGRINTRNSYAIKYGRVEVTAKLPVGDWIWPAIWMMPVNNTYGNWPQSGEIDIAESRGNGIDFVSVDAQGGTSKGGHDTVVSTLHWGVNTPYLYDQSGLTTNGLTFPTGTTSLTNDFHIFGIEWTPNSIRTYVDKKLTRIAYFPMPKKGFWSLGAFNTISLGQGYNFLNPWVGSIENAPFDQEFYLIMNVAVGGLGYFNTIDGILPWNVGDGRNLAMKQFMDAKGTWEQTWGSDEERGLVVSKVKMWKLCN